MILVTGVDEIMKNRIEIKIFLILCLVWNLNSWAEEHIYSNGIDERNYVVISPEILRPYISYGIMVHVFDNVFNRCSNRTVDLYASIDSSKNDSISSLVTNLFCNTQEIINLQIPISLPSDVYKLHVFAVDSVDKKKIFDNSKQLIYERNFVSVVFQTTRPIYSSGQLVRFRILVLQTSLIPFNDVMDVFVLDPDGLIMKRWLSTFTNNGVVTLNFKLPKLAKDGVWKIRSVINNQVDEQSIIVETYFQPFFEVVVSSPAYVPDTEDTLDATIYGIFSSQKLVRGNATITWSARKYRENDTFHEIQTDSVFIKEIRYEATLLLEAIYNVFETLVGIEVKISVSMTEFLSGETMSGFSHSRIISNNIKIKFLSQSPVIFTPGMSLLGYVSVSYNDGEKIPRNVLENSILKIELKCDAVFSDGKHVAEITIGDSIETEDMDLYEILVKNEIREKYLETGVIAYNFDVPSKATSANLKATFIREEIREEVEIDCIKRDSIDGKYIRVWTSSDDLKVHEYAIFHMKTNFVMNTFYSIVLSKNIILQVHEHEMSSGSLITFSIPISGDMAPLFHLIVYGLSNDRVIRSDAVTVPVDGFSRYQTTFEVNTGKDFKIERVEALASGGEGAFIGIQASRSVVHQLQGGNEITRSRITNNFMKFEKNSRSVNKIDRVTRDGSLAPESVYFLAHNFVLDDAHSFELNRLIIWSNFNESNKNQDGKCDYYKNKDTLCLLRSCALKSEFCNSQSDCSSDHSTQTNCINFESPDEKYYLNRMNRNYFIYDADEGDWGFTQIKKNDHVGVEFEFLNTPKSSDDWYFTVFNMHMIFGFSIMEQPVVFSSTRPLMAYVMGPRKCHRGEQLGLKLHLHNHDCNEMFVVVTLVASDDYKFVNVENEGMVSTYAARLTSGDRQILVHMPAKSQTELRFPVAPSVERGLIEIVFLVSSQTGRVNLSHFVQVKGEGVLTNRHTSFTLDLKNRGLTLEYLDIITEESPFVPYQYWRRYVYGSTAANLTISNDIIGPISFENLFTLDTLLKREPKGAIDYASELNTNIWILHYLRLTNQLTPEILKNTLKECNSLYSTVIRYFNVNGFFSNWEPVSFYPSVWLSAWVIRILKYANFSEWQFLIWIDPYIIKKTLQWLLTHQHSDGYFTETVIYQETPFDSRFIFNNEKYYRMALTAHVLITIQTVVEFGNGDMNTQVVISILNARHYLEKELSSIHDPYLLALISYSLRITNSPDSNYAFTRLQKAMRVNEDGFFYWSQIPIPSNPVKLENQRPYRMPRLYQKTDSEAVEATSWALLVYLANEGITPLVENIVNWLISTRMSNHGFISLIDTNVAYQALAEYAHRSRFLDITNIYLNVEIMASNVTSHHLHISNKSIDNFIFEIPFVWGHVHVAGKGSGMAYIQMDVNYGVDHEHLVDQPQLKLFDLQIVEFYSQFRNKSMITIQSCLRFTGESLRSSGAVILEIQIPTGYFLLETQASEIIRHKVHPTLRDVRTIEGKTVWFFDFVGRESHCFNHTVTRWYPVGNMTLCRQALLYALTAREHFVQVLINSTALQTLSICEVCGSFQCPYCPYFNRSVISVKFFKFLLCIPILVFMIEVVFQ